LYSHLSWPSARSGTNRYLIQLWLKGILSARGKDASQECFVLLLPLSIKDGKTP
jgi:hypothetical protein